MKKNRLLFLLIPFILVLFAFLGCGGSNGGTGRMVEKGELVPFSPFTEDTTQVVSDDVDSLIESAYTLFEIQEYSNATAAFSNLTSRTDLSTNQRVKSLVGLGWSQFKSQGADASISSFNETVSLSPGNADAKVALGAALVQSNANRDVNRAVTLLEEVGLGNTAFVYNQERRFGISNAEAHALLALAYWLRNQTGDRDAAKGQINTAKAADSAGDSSVAQIEQTLITLNGGPL
ncbi:hypothetical protein ACFL35_09865 [Candidatus Riflebacteria bacterium]